MKDYPLIKFVILFAAGIVLSRILHISLLTVILILTFALFVSTLLIFFRKGKFGLIKQIFLFLCVITTGLLYGLFFSEDNASYPFNDPKILNAELSGEIQSIELPGNEKLAFTMLVDETSSQQLKSPKKYLAIVNVYDLQTKIYRLAKILLPGREIKITGTLSEPRNQRNPGEFDYKKYLNRKGVAAVFSTYKTDNVIVSGNSSDISKSFIYKIRMSINDKIMHLYDHKTAGLLRGLLLADRSQIDYSDKESFINAGVIHILAVSGLHVGYIILIFLFLFSRLNIYLRYIFTSTGLIFFLLITNSPPSVFRAVAMALVLIVSLITNRSYNGYNAIAFSALIILIINPNELFSAGFQLSFTAVISILYFYPIFQRVILDWNIKSKTIKAILLFVCVSVAAQIGTLPITIIYFQKLSLVSIFANLIVIPLAGVIVGLGILTIVVSYFWYWLALVYAEVTKLCSEFLFWFVSKAAGLKHSYILINHFTNLDILFYFVFLVIIIILFKKFPNVKTRIVFFILIVLNYAVFTSLNNTSILAENKLSIVGIDVGQGDSFLIKFPDGKAALIDAGNATPNYDNGIRTIYPLLRYLDIDAIDYAFITHIDADHYAGYLSLFEKGIIKKVFKPELDTSQKRDIDLEKKIRQNKIPIRYYGKSILKIDNARIYLLNNFGAADYYNLSNNNRSGFMKLVFGNTSYLFTGDAGIIAENYYVDMYGDFLKSDLLKVGHHGSKTSTGSKFLNYVSPKYALISAGLKNKFNHPNKEVLNKLKAKNVDISRTDLEGAVIFESDGYSISKVDWRNKESAFNLE